MFPSWGKQENSAIAQSAYTDLTDILSLTFQITILIYFCLSHKASAGVDYGWLHTCYLNQEKNVNIAKTNLGAISVLHINIMMKISHVYILIFKMTMVAWEFGMFLFIYEN